MLTLAALLLLLPLAVLIDALALRRRWHAVPLQQRNLTRATAGAFVLVVCAVLAVHRVIGLMVAAGVAAFALLYLVVGIVGVRSPGAFDPMAAFWWGLLVVIAGGSLALFHGISAVMMWIELVGFAVLAGAVVRVALIVWPPPGAKLPDPSKVAGMPMAGPASQKAAHTTINRRRV